MLFIILHLVNQESEKNLYHDRGYWIIDDQGISAVKDDDKRTDIEDDGPEVEMSNPSKKEEGYEYL